MAMVHSSRRTRNQATDAAMMTAEILRTILHLEQLQEERRANRELMQTELRQLKQIFHK